MSATKDILHGLAELFKALDWKDYIFWFIVLLFVFNALGQLTGLDFLSDPWQIILEALQHLGGAIPQLG